MAVSVSLQWFFRPWNPQISKRKDIIHSVILKLRVCQKLQSESKLCIFNLSCIEAIKSCNQQFSSRKHISDEDITNYVSSSAVLSGQKRQQNAITLDSLQESDCFCNIYRINFTFGCCMGIPIDRKRQICH